MHPSPFLTGRLAAAGAAVTLLAGCASASSSSGGPSLVASAAAPTAATASPSPVPIVLDHTRWIAYQVCLDCNGMDDEIWLEHPDGTANHEISAAFKGHTVHPDFSRDGKRLTFANWVDPLPVQLYVSAAGGTGIRRITTCKPPACLGYDDPAWSPDGTRLAIYTDLGPPQNDVPIANGIAVLDLSTGRVTQVEKHPGADGQDHFPRWSPDGRFLVFWRERTNAAGSPETAIFIVSIRDASIRQLTAWGELAGDPDWSPDGRWIVYSTHPLLTDWGGRVASDLVTIHPDGTDRTEITHFGLTGPRATQPRWTPDGKAIIYTLDTRTGDIAGRQIWVISADGSSNTSVLSALQVYSHPVLQP